jgi:hypothetical protein
VLGARHSSGGEAALSLLSSNRRIAACAADGAPPVPTKGVQRVEFHPVETKERAGVKPPSTKPQQ